MALKTISGRVREVDIRRVRPPAKTADPIYLAAEHRAWRDAVIRRAGGRCEWPDGGGRVCGRAERRMFADHIRELRDGGERLDPGNGQCLCGRHHSLKTAAERAARMAGPG